MWTRHRFRRDTRCRRNRRICAERPFTGGRPILERIAVPIDAPTVILLFLSSLLGLSSGVADKMFTWRE